MKMHNNLLLVEIEKPCKCYICNEEITINNAHLLNINKCILKVKQCCNNCVSPICIDFNTETKTGKLNRINLHNIFEEKCLKEYEQKNKCKLIKIIRTTDGSKPSG